VLVLTEDVASFFVMLPWSGATPYMTICCDSPPSFPYNRACATKRISIHQHGQVPDEEVAVKTYQMPKKHVHHRLRYRRSTRLQSPYQRTY